MWRSAGPDTALIFSECDVTHVKNRVLDSPVSADHAQQGSRIGLVTAQRGDAIKRFGFSLASAGAAAREFECLRHERPG